MEQELKALQDQAKADEKLEKMHQKLQYQLEINDENSPSFKACLFEKSHAEATWFCVAM
jgi:hypothetical protein